MQTRKLGTQGLEVSALGLGCMGMSWGYKNVADYQGEGDVRRTHPRFQGENFERNVNLIEALEALATRTAHTPAQLVLAWLLHQGEDIVPIPGTQRRRYLAENVAAAGIQLAGCDQLFLAEHFPRNVASGARYGEVGMRWLDR